VNNEQRALAILAEHDCSVDYDRICVGCICHPWPGDRDHDAHAAHLVQLLAEAGLLASTPQEPE
jgi:hypothetical protein